MKIILITFLFLFSSYWSAAQVDVNQRMDVSAVDQSVADAVIEIARLAKISIAFQPNLFNDNQKVSINANGETLESLLKRCLDGTGVDFKIEDDQLILFKKSRKKITISGYVQDAKSGEKIILANIYSLNPSVESLSNEYGFFSLQLPVGKINLQSNYIGYESDPLILNLDKDTTITISMNPFLTTGAVEIVDRSINNSDRRYRTGKGRVIVQDDVRNQPTLGGESDIYRYIQSQAGVSSGADGLGGLYVRGGNAEHNLVLLDGVPVFNPSHTLGLFSIFNSSAIRSARFVKDGFSARYGGRLASVVDVRTKEGNTLKKTGEIEVGTIATKAMIELPIKKNKSALLLSGRRTHIDGILSNYSFNKKAENLEDGVTNYNFYDFNLKYHSAISERSKLYLSYYQGGDDFKDLVTWEDIYDDGTGNDLVSSYYQDQQLFWNNRIGSVRWNSSIGNQSFINVTATYSRYNYGSFNEAEYIDEGFNDLPYYNDVFDNRSQVTDAGLRVDVDSYVGKHQLRYGGAVLSRDFIPASLLVSSETDEVDVEGVMTTLDSSETFIGYLSKEYVGYFEDLIDLGGESKLQIGLRAAAFEATNKTHISLQPRLSFSFPITEKWQGSLSVTKSTQFLHVLSSSDAGLPTDIWVPSTDDVDPEHAYQISVGMNGAMKNGWGIELGAYYKKMTGLLSYDEESKQPGLVETDPEYWEEFVLVGEGESYGAELGLYKSEGELTGAFNYTYSQSTRQFPDVNNGNAFPFSFDRPHNINLQLAYRLSNRIQLQVAAYFSEGRPITLLSIPGGFSPLANYFGGVDQVSAVNEVRLDPYRRIDVNLNMQFGQGSTKHVLNLGVYNLLNTQNEYYRYISADDDSSNSERSLPLLPTISYKVMFGGSEG